MRSTVSVRRTCRVEVMGLLKARGERFPNQLRERYFNWLKSQIEDCPEMKRGWDRLLRKLQQTEFRWILEGDEDRAENGIGLRFRFGWEKNYDIRDVDICLNDRPCSMLELMVALAAKIEVVLSDDHYGNRTGEWFFSMVKSLGLGRMDDRSYDSDLVNVTLERFVKRRYRPDGRGGLFTVEGETDMPDLEIWQQMNIWMIAG